MEATVVLPEAGRSAWKMPFGVRCVAARQGVAVMDASTLGKIDIQGPDAAVFLDRIYTNMFLDIAGRAVPLRIDVQG
jgi:glycine cleavage system aminomethyltransferase T